MRGSSRSLGGFSYIFCFFRLSPLCSPVFVWCLGSGTARVELREWSLVNMAGYVRSTVYMLWARQLVLQYCAVRDRLAARDLSLPFYWLIVTFWIVGHHCILLWAPSVMELKG